MSYALLDKDIDQLCSAISADDTNALKVLIEAGVNVDSVNNVSMEFICRMLYNVFYHTEERFDNSEKDGFSRYYI